MFYLDQQRATREERNKIRERPKDTLNIGQHAARFEREDDDHQAASPPIFFRLFGGSNQSAVLVSVFVAVHNETVSESVAAATATTTR